MAIARISLGLAGAVAGGAAASVAIIRKRQTKVFLKKESIGKIIVTEFKDLVFWSSFEQPGFRQHAPVLLRSLHPRGRRAMSPQSSSLLIAVEAEELFRRFETYICSDLRAGRDLRALHCRPEQTDSKLREHDTDAVIVIQPRFHDELPAAVRRWKRQRPDLQVL